MEGIVIFVGLGVLGALGVLTYRYLEGKWPFKPTRSGF